jgi:hypothetical protein
MNALDHNTGVEVLDLQSNAEFLARPSHQRDALAQLAGMQRLAHTFTENSDGVLQELSDIAVQLCGAESAGISLETFGPEGQQLFQWVAISGDYAPFLNAYRALPLDALWRLSGSPPASDNSRASCSLCGNGSRRASTSYYRRHPSPMACWFYTGHHLGPGSRQNRRLRPNGLQHDADVFGLRGHGRQQSATAENDSATGACRRRGRYGERPRASDQQPTPEAHQLDLSRGHPLRRCAGSHQAGQQRFAATFLTRPAIACPLQ